MYCHLNDSSSPQLHTMGCGTFPCAQRETTLQNQGPSELEAPGLLLRGLGCGWKHLLVEVGGTVYPCGRRVQDAWQWRGGVQWPSNALLDLLLRTAPHPDPPSRGCGFQCRHLLWPICSALMAAHMAPGGVFTGCFPLWGRVL